MGRLTQKDWKRKSQGGIPWTVHPVKHIDDLPYYKRLAAYEDTGFTPEQVVEMAKELAEYKKLEEQGLLLKLPCKVGDTVWVITRPYNVTGDECDIGSKKEVFEAKCESVTIYKKSIQYRFAVDEGLIGEYFANDSFGKTVFLTQEEAEAKLKEMESE